VLEGTDEKRLTEGWTPVGIIMEPEIGRRICGVSAIARATMAWAPSGPSPFARSTAAFNSTQRCAASSTNLRVSAMS